MLILMRASDGVAKLPASTTAPRAVRIILLIAPPLLLVRSRLFRGRRLVSGVLPQIEGQPLALHARQHRRRRLVEGDDAGRSAAGDDRLLGRDRLAVELCGNERLGE